MKNINDGNFKLVIAGGGVAGWIAALFFNNIYPKLSITVIESNQIGILGAGEGTVPFATGLFNYLNIPLSVLVKNCDATIKNGIKFTNWNGDNKHYYHSFVYESQSSINYFCKSTDFVRLPLGILKQIKDDKYVSEYDIVSEISEQGKTVFYMAENIGDKVVKDPIQKYVNFSNYAFHFNATKMASYLKEVGKARGVIVKEGIIEKINEDKNGNISSFILNDKTEVKCDFVFDCTGLKRLIIGKHFKTKWNSYQDYIPNNRAITFTLPLEKGKPLPPYTEAIAMKYGWIWKIPTTSRYGCGYVFDSRLLSNEEAKKEIEELVGSKVEIQKSFSFEAGCFEKTWVKNCIALGLSSGFVEPLEATSIFSTCLSLHNLRFNIKGVLEDNSVNKELFNNYVNKLNINTRDFINFHYHTKRTDTVYWKDFTKNNKTIDFVEIMKKYNNSIEPLLYDITGNDSIIDYNMYGWSSWLAVGAGIKFFNKEEVGRTYDALMQDRALNNYQSTELDFYLNYTEQLKPLIVTHKSLLNDLYAN